MLYLSKFIELGELVEDFILQKSIDRSLFNRGFAVPAEMQAVLSKHLTGGALIHGERRLIKILFDGEIHDATLTSINFNRRKFPQHREIWQIVYSKDSSLAQSFRQIFSRSFEALSHGGKTSENLVLYATDFQDTFCIEPILKSELQLDADETLLEKLLELPTLTDADAALVEKFQLTKIRRLNRSIGENLKALYDFRCQICGKNFGAAYGVPIVECHHINYFARSLNNDAANLLIVCPNHHSVIHSANPIFERRQKIFRYPNGYVERLKINLHL